MEAVCYLGDAQLGGSQQERGFHQKHLVDIVHNGAATDPTDHAGEVNCGDMELVGIERDVMMLRKVSGSRRMKPMKISSTRCGV